MLALLFVLTTVTVAQVPNPRPNGWVSDQAEVFPVEGEQHLNQMLDDLHQKRGIEIAVVTVDDVRETPKQFATALFNHWKIGSAASNNGVLVLLVMKKRRLEIETGTGIEAALPADWLAEMQAQWMIPAFKGGDFNGGLKLGVKQIVDRLLAAPGESTSTSAPGEYRDNGKVAVAPGSGDTSVVTAPAGSAVPPHDEPPPEIRAAHDDDGGPSTGVLVGGGLGVVGAGGATAALIRWQRRRRICTKCQPERKMLPLDEVEDDQHLDAGQRKEENLRSVDYEVVICPGCQDARTLRHNKWFSGYSRCSSCSYKTLRSDSTTIVSATYDHGGQVRVTEDCQHCSYHNTYTRYTSKLTRPSTTSSSGGSSYRSSSGGGGGFSGGSSRGGGAGSSW